MASISGNNKIVLKGDFGTNEEGILSGAATPGMNIAQLITDEVQQRSTYAVAGTDNVGTGTGVTTTKAPIKIVKEDYLQGNTIADAYADGDNVFFFIPVPGNVLQVLVASGQDLTKGDGLSAGSNGKWTVDATNAAVEALEDSGGALGADTHVRVRVL